MPWVMACRVVSLPATARIMKKNANSSLFRRWPVGVGLDEPAGHVPEVVLEPRLGRGMGVGEHLDDAREVERGVLRILAARHLVAPVEELLAIAVGDAHEAGDGLQGQMTRHVDHEVARAVLLGRPHDPLRPARAGRPRGRPGPAG